MYISAKNYIFVKEKPKKNLGLPDEDIPHTADYIIAWLDGKGKGHYGGNQFDKRIAIYWNPQLPLNKNGRAEVELYNNGKHRQINTSAEEMTEDGTILEN